VSDRDNPAPTLDSQNTQTKLDTAPTPGDTEATLGSAPAVEATARRDLASIGPYRLVKKLGEGGMGQVWLAEQTAPLQRQVALKLIKVGIYDDSVLQRFQSERQSLAIMEHPSIAKVFDAGATVDGQPYFVMEYVPGVPITDYCDQKRLKIRERLELFVKVCEGVQHAHQKAIIHRDLKPANILVAEVDGKPVPRIIDFGLAKAATPQAVAETMFTQVGAFVGTPGYMSPEQADPKVQDVDTRTDVYSLGVVLYVLLTGFLPFDTKQWDKQPLYEVLRRLREEEPRRPSTKIRMEKESATGTAEMRGTEPKQLVSLLHGDLDCITIKALEKDRARRYGTPSELAGDITRYLGNEPVVARPASTSYRLRKYVRRHRIGVAAAAGVVAVLIAFAVMQAVQLRRITRERDRANRITEFMTNMFKVSDPSEARGNSITAREIMDTASKEIDAGLAKDPELQAQMMNVMGKVYENLGLFPRAHSLLTGAVDIRRRVLGPRNPDTLTSMSNLGSVLDDEGHYAEAEKLLRETGDIQRRVLGPNHPDTLFSMNELGWALLNEGRHAEAEKLDRETLDIRRRVLGPEHPDTLRSMASLAGTLEQQGHYPEAEKLQRDVLDIDRRVLGPEHPGTLTAMLNLSVYLLDEGRYAEAEKLLRETGDIQRRVLGPEHEGTLLTMLDLSVTLTREGRYAEAEKLLRETGDIQRRVLGPEHEETLLTRVNLAETLGREGRYAEAEKLVRETGDIQRRVLGHNHPDTALSTETLAEIFALAGKRDEALSLLRDAVDDGLSPAIDLYIEKDPDLKSLHGDPRFDALVAHAKERAAAAAKKQ
jgi:serine/threonine protein kinase/tetratricopeptide (TPR) repeat protein